MNAISTKNAPFYFKATLVLFGFVLLAYTLSGLADILIPLAFAGVISILLNPLYLRLHKWGLPQVVAISLCLLAGVVVLGGIFYFLGSQLSHLSDSFPLLKQKFNILLHDFQSMLQEKFNISVKKQVEVLNKGAENGSALIGQTLGTALGWMGIFLLIPVYVFLLLFYKTLLLNFLYEVFDETHSEHVAHILNQTKAAIQSYMVGLLLEMLIVAILNSAALLLLGVDYAILFGVIGAILNVIPYIGGIVAIALPVLMATVTRDGYSTQLGILLAYTVIQFVDNNILVPRIVSSKVQINALISIITVLLGGALWGVPGMFLSIPAVAILKIIFDRVEELKPWGKLLGDEIPTRHKGEIWFRSMLRRGKQSPATK